MNHMGQCVTDLERSRTFYEEALGFEYWRHARARRLAQRPAPAACTPPLGFRACYLRAGTVRARAAALRRLRRRARSRSGNAR